MPDNVPTPFHPNVSTGKYRRLTRLADAQGRFAMLAIDQRGSLRRMFAQRVTFSDAHAEAKAFKLVKRVVTEAVAPLATAVLTDPLFGLKSSLDVIPRDVGILLSLEKTGYEAADDAARRSRLIEGWSVERILRTGADAVKLLIWHHPAASDATHRHQQEIVEAAGAACAAAEMPFVLEVVTYGLNGADKRGPAFAAEKPALVADAAEIYSASQFQVDLLKLEFPANLKYAEEYQHTDFAAGTTVYGRGEIERACALLDERSAAPWVILSAGVDPEEFAVNLELANAAGASGFLCGRAVWKHVVDSFPDEARMSQFMDDRGRTYFRQLLEANAGANPWHGHRRFQHEPADASFLG